MLLRARCRCRPLGRFARQHSASPARGFSILEILAALLVIAAGIIGIAALYSDAAHTNSEAQLRTRAAELAAEIAQRINENSAGRVGYAGTVGVLCKPDARPSGAQDEAANEAACWEDQVEQALPNGFGTITRDPSTSPVSYIVSVSWSAPERGAASYVIQVSPEEKK